MLPLLDFNTIFTDFNRATEAFELAKQTLMEDIETVEILNVAEGRWVIVFRDIIDGEITGRL